MDVQHGDERYVSRFFENMQDGCGGYELIRLQAGREDRVATVLYWDAMGQFFVETFGDVPLRVMELLIEEAKTNTDGAPRRA
jgi:hypothetical protein